MDLAYLAAIGLFCALMIGLATGCARLGGASRLKLSCEALRQCVTTIEKQLSVPT